MCPLWPVHIILLYAIMLGPLWLMLFGVVGAAAQKAFSPLNISFSPDRIQQLKVDSTQTVKLHFNSSVTQNGTSNKPVYFQLQINDHNIATVEPEKLWVENLKSIDENGTTSLDFNVTGKFLGYSKVCAIPVDSNNKSKQDETCMEISVVRKPRIVDKVFTYSVVLLVTAMYINMGAALDLDIIKETIRRPYGPAIGLFSQFAIMPLLSYGIAKLLIPRPELQLGLFITGCSPGGGASNMWTLAMGGNLDLSVTMTAVSTFAAFALMPFWIFTLGSTIFSEAKLTVPYSKIGTFAISLIVPLGIGIGIQLRWPKVAKFLVKILKPFAACLLVFIVVFAIYTNWYLLQLLTWPILLSGMLLPWLGYLLGGGLALLLRREWEDIIAIAVETGVQNTGLSIFALRFSLGQPEADLTTVLPVAVAIMTPVFPLFVLGLQKLHKKAVQRSGFSLTDKEINDDSVTGSLSPSI